MKSRRNSTTPRPFLKWAGGKRSLVPEILDLLPRGPIDTYVEPFVGGGALFFALARTRRFRRAVLADRNPELINTYLQVRDAVGDVVAAVRGWAYGDSEAYYAVRDLDPGSLSPVERAARTLYLNRTCFNGLYRLNRSGRFNVPFGSHRLPEIVDEVNLRACSEALDGVEILAQGFDETLAMAGTGCVVYCDPPYWPLSRTANFTAYDQLPFGADEHQALNAAFRALAGRGAFGLLSNSVTPETTELYAGLPSQTVYVRRNINRDANGRGAVAEYLVSTA